MKQIFTLSFLVLSFVFTSAQTANLVVFTELGEKFTLYLNGESQNDAPKANVKVSGLTGEFYQARIDFEDAALADFAQNSMMVQAGTEVTYLIKKNKKGEYVLRFNGEAPISGSSVATDSDISEAKKISVVDKGTAVETTPAVKTVEEPETIDSAVHTTVTTTTTSKSSTTPAPAPTSEKVGINMNVGGVSMGVNMNIEGEGMDMDMNMDAEETETTTVTTTTKTSGTKTATTPVKPAAVPAPAPEIVTVAGCSSPMSKTAFESAKTSIDGKGFDDVKLSTAKQVAKSNCMSSAQIKDVMDLFGFEETKLAFAKYAYDYCTDTNNYYVVSDAFGFSSSTEELNTYIESKGK